MIDRRTFVVAGLALAGCSTRPGRMAASGGRFEPIRASLGPGARLGVAAINLGTGRTIEFDANSRYAMCSTFKLPLAAAILEKADRSELSLADEIRFGPSDLLEYAPAVRAAIPRGSLSIAHLCAAAVEVSDNSATNLLLPRVGGPAGLTAFMRKAGDAITRLDRNEPELNTNLPGDPRDTTTPGAMLGLLRAILVGDVLTPFSRPFLIQWMVNASTGRDRLRAGLPGWQAGDKTGTGPNGANNDVAIAWPPSGAPILIASFISGGDAPNPARNAAHAAVAREIASALA